MKPEISVCMPAFNQSRYIGLALESVRTQSRSDFEVIVMDDGSTDGTREAVVRVGDPRVRYFRHRKQIGVGKSRNACLKVARGRYVSWLDADDRYQPHALETLATTLDQHPTVGLVHGGFNLIDERGLPLRTWEAPFPTDVIESGRQAFEELVVSNYITTSTVILRRDLLSDVGQFADEVGRSSTDWNMWLRVALRTDIAYRAESLTEYRQHPDTISATSSAGERLRCDIRAVDQVFRTSQPWVSSRKDLYRRAKAALAFRCLMQAGDALQRKQQVASVSWAFQAFVLAGSLAGGRGWGRLFTALLRRDEYRCFWTSKAILAQLYRPIEQTRYGQKVAKIALVDPEWQRTMSHIAATVRDLTPRDARIAAVDKNDPSLIHLSGRTGRHFPDPRPDGSGNPLDSEEAIDHLEAIRSEGVSYFVLPCFAFWWLDFYQGFRSHLESRYRCAWSDDKCLIYELLPRDGATFMHEGRLCGA